MNNFYKNFIILLIGVITINTLVNLYPYRFDLTSTKKYSLSNNTQNTLKSIQDIIYFKIYLHGDIPIEYKRLEKEIKHLINELRSFSQFIEFEFIDPSKFENEDYRIGLQKELFNEGINPIPHRNYENNKMEETWVFPGIIATYKNKKTTISLIKKSLMSNPENVINEAIEKLEYHFVNAIRDLTTKKKTIGIIDGHGETTNNSINGFRDLISINYNIKEIDGINGQLEALKDIDCIIINNPTSYINEKDKFIIDQFIMKGGRSIWFISGSNASMDSLETHSQSIALPNSETNLNDMLFKFGIRINYDIIQDLQAAPIPIITHYLEDKPQWTFFPWTFFPILASKNNHIINQHINPVKSQFPSSIDTLQNKIRKTILLQSSDFSKKTSTPALINLETLKEKPQQKIYKDGPQITAVLLEGVFESIFINRIPQKIATNENIKFQKNTINTEGKDTTNKLIVISDGHFISNQFKNNQHLPIGFDKHTNNQYGNGDFILNCLDYLLDTKHVISVRNKDIDIRMLNKQKIQTEKFFWQVFNTFSPLGILFLIGLFIFNLPIWCIALEL